MKLLLNKFNVKILVMCCLLCACDKNAPADNISESEPKQTPISQNSTQANHKTDDSQVIHFEGFGPAKFGDNEESVRMSWGRPLEASEPAVGATCYYLHLEPKPESKQQIAFMLEDGKFVRYDIDDPKWIAPGNIVVGDAMQKVMRAHAGRVENQPHKYIEGAHTLIVTPTQTEQKNRLSSARLIFETDANHIVTNWRIGVAPQVYYVEGCN